MANKYCGPSAADIAQANLDAERNVTPRMYSWINETNMVGLVDLAGNPYPAGTMGEITSIEDTGTGLVRMSIDGSDPVTAAGNTFLITGPYHSGFNLKNVDLSLVRLNGSSTGSDFSIMYHEYN